MKEKKMLSIIYVGSNLINYFRLFSISEVCLMVNGKEFVNKIIQKKFHAVVYPCGIICIPFIYFSFQIPGSGKLSNKRKLLVHSNYFNEEWKHFKLMDSKQSFSIFPGNLITLHIISSTIIAFKLIHEACSIEQYWVSGCDNDITKNLTAHNFQQH